MTHRETNGLAALLAAVLFGFMQAPSVILKDVQESFQTVRLVLK